MTLMTPTQVVVSPTSLAVSNLLSSNSALQNPQAANITAVSVSAAASIVAVNTAVTTMNANILAGVGAIPPSGNQAALLSLQTHLQNQWVLTTVGGTSMLQQILDHTNYASGAVVPAIGLGIPSFTSRLSIMNSHISLSNGIASAGGTPNSNPCSLVASFFGSIINGVEALIGAAAALASLVITDILALAALAASVLATLEGIVAAVTSLIAAELAAIANAVTALEKFALSALLQIAVNGLCTAAVVAAVATTELADTLGI